MSLRRQIALGTLVLLALTEVAVLVGGGATAPGSTLSREPLGWMVARRYAEERGIEIRLLDRLDEPPGADWALFFVFPWQRPNLGQAQALAVRHLLAGGTVVLAYTGGNDPRAAAAERDVLESLGIFEHFAARQPTPLHPLRWREAKTAEWPLLPVGTRRPGRPAHVRRMPRLPRARRAMPLFESPDGQVLVSTFAHGRGRIVLLPAEALANGRLVEPGNAALAETLIATLPRRWAFDELHHDLLAVPIGDTGRHSERAFVLFFLHVVLFYLLAVMAQVRRLGPAWREPPTVSGSVRSFFIGVGALHAERGHQQEAARLMLERARALDPTLTLDARSVANIGRDNDAFVRHAQAVADAQHRRK